MSNIRNFKKNIEREERLLQRLDRRIAKFQEERAKQSDLIRSMRIRLEKALSGNQTS